MWGSMNRMSFTGSRKSLFLIIVYILGFWKALLSQGLPGQPPFLNFLFVPGTGVQQPDGRLITALGGGQGSGLQGRFIVAGKQLLYHRKDRRVDEPAYRTPEDRVHGA